MLSAKAYAQRHQGLAIISELSRIVSPDIRLISLKVKLGGVPTPISAASVKPSEVIKEVEVEGFVLGAKKAHDTALANFTMKLDNSPLFQQVKIQKTNEETFKRTALLRFVISMRVEGL
jgi:hypothetical protein